MLNGTQFSLTGVIIISAFAEDFMLGGLFFLCLLIMLVGSTSIIGENSRPLIYRACWTFFPPG